MAMHQQVRMLGRLRREVAAEFQQTDHVFLLWRSPADVLFNKVVKAQLELLMFTKTAEYLGYRSVRIKNGEDVARASLAVVGQLLNAANGDPERRYRVHASHSVSYPRRPC